MSAIAKVLLEQGHSISGTDLKRSRALTTLEAMGADVQLGHQAQAVEGADTAVVSAAIPESNPELKRAHELGIPVITRGEALAALLESSRAIVVAGTHGKTTTTSMIVSILRHAGMDPTYLVGGGLNDAGTNARFGSGDYSVAESDESDGSFLLLHPQIAVVTNVEADHLDYWGSLEAIREAFVRFLGSVDVDGAVVLPIAEAELSSTAAARVLTFGEGGDVTAEQVEQTHEGTRFVLSVAGEHLSVALRVPGIYNVMNSLAAAASAYAAGVPLAEVAKGLGAYRGVERRFQIRGTTAGVTVIDDYAHHPTEVRSVLSAARSGAWSRVLAVFQPHRYSRAVFFDDFGDAFHDADVIVVTDVYGAGEEPIPGVTGKLVADAVCEHLPGRLVAYLPHRDELIGYLCHTARPGDALLTLGAGDVTSIGEELLARLQTS